MTVPATIAFRAMDLDAVTSFDGVVAVVVPQDGTLAAGARRVDRAAKGAVKRAVESPAWAKLKDGAAMELAFPQGMAASAAMLVRLPGDPRPRDGDARGRGAGQGPRRPPAPGDRRRAGGPGRPGAGRRAARLFLRRPQDT